VAIVQVYSSSPEAFLVSSFLLETANGVVVIDTQFLVTSAKLLRQKVIDLGKPLLTESLPFRKREVPEA
jgi:hypothetical protein